MSENPEEVTLRLLRETRAEMVARFDGIDHRLHWIEQRLGGSAVSGAETSEPGRSPQVRDRDVGTRHPT